MSDDPVTQGEIERLRHSEERYRSVVERSPVGIAIHVVGRLAYVNAAGARIFGAPIEELLGRAVLDFVHPEDRAEATERMRRVMEHRESTPMRPLRGLRSDASTVFLEIAGSPVMFDGRPASQIIFVDVGDRRRVEHEVSRLRKAVDASGEIIFLTDREGLLTFVNPEFTRVYGWTAEEVIGQKTPRILKSGLASQGDIVEFWSRIVGKQVARAEYQNRTKDGRLIRSMGRRARSWTSPGTSSASSPCSAT